MKVHPATQFKGKYNDIVIPELNPSCSQQMGKIGRRTGQLFIDDEKETGYDFLLKDNSISVKTANKANDKIEYSSDSSSDESSSSLYESSSEAEESTPDDETNAIEINLEEIKKTLNESTQDNYNIETEEEKEVHNEEKVKEEHNADLFKSKEDIFKQRKQAADKKLSIEGLSTIKKNDKNDQSLIADNGLLDELNNNKRASFGTNPKNKTNKVNQSVDTIKLDGDASFELSEGTKMASNYSKKTEVNKKKTQPQMKNQIKAKSNKTIVEVEYDDDSDDDNDESTIEYIVKLNDTTRSNITGNDKSASNNQSENENEGKKDMQEKKTKPQESKSNNTKLNNKGLKAIKEKKMYKEEDQPNNKSTVVKKKEEKKKKTQMKPEQIRNVNPLIENSGEDSKELEENTIANDENISMKKDEIIQDTKIFPQHNDISYVSTKSKRLIQDDEIMQDYNNYDDNVQDHSDGSLPLEKVDFEPKEKAKETTKNKEKVEESTKIKGKEKETTKTKDKEKEIKNKKEKEKVDSKAKEKIKPESKTISKEKDEEIPKEKPKAKLKKKTSPPVDENKTYIEISDQDDQSSIPEVFQDKPIKMKPQVVKDKAQPKQPKKISSSKKKIVSQSDYEKLAYSQLTQAIPKALDVVHSKKEQTFGKNGRYSLRVRVPKLNPLLGEKLQYIHTPEGDQIRTIYSSRSVVQEVNAKYEIGKPKRRKLRKGIKQSQEDTDKEDEKKEEEDELDDSYSEIEEDENIKLIVIKPKSQKNLSKNYQAELLLQIRESSRKNAIIVNNKEYRDLKRGMSINIPPNCQYQIKNFSKTNLVVAISLVQHLDSDSS